MMTRLVLTVLALTPSIAIGQSIDKPPDSLRFATFNASLNRELPGQLVRELSTPDNPQARNVAEIIQLVRPDVLLINEFDYEKGSQALGLFRKNYLSVGQNGAKPIEFPFVFSAEVNTGVSSGVDLDNDGKTVTEPGSRGYGNDAIGFGQFPGQYGMVILSKVEIDINGVRDFHRLLWKDVPGALLPTKPDGSPWYSQKALDVLRLSSKSHWDVPIVHVGPADRTIHLLVSHPTPPAFDGPEDRNGKRNHDEIRVWADYLTGGPKAEYLRRALPPDTAITPPETFVVMGDQNADPVDGGSVPGAIQQLLDHPKVNATFRPRSAGATDASRSQGQANDKHKGDPGLDTADFTDSTVGNLRVDYVLPSRNLTVVDGGVFWPRQDDPLLRLVRMTPVVASSDHRLVYVDVKNP